MKVSVILYKSKTLANGHHPLMIRINDSKNKKYLSTGLSCLAKWWDFKKNSPNKSNPNRKYLKTVIENKKAIYSLQISTLESGKNKPTIEQLFQTVEKKSPANYFDSNVFTFLSGLVSNLQDCGKIKGANLYKLLHNSLSTFVGNNNLLFADIDLPFLNRYESFLYKKNVVENTMRVHFELLRALFNKAIRSNLVKKEDYPFSNYLIGKFNTSTQKRAINKEDIKRIESLTLNPDSRLQEARDYFLFSYYGHGINFKDIACLQWKQTTDERITYKRSKTGMILTFILREPIIEILDRYRPTTGIDSENYVFPILDRYKHVTPAKIVNRVNRVIGRVNRSLQELAQQAGIPVRLTTYVARHTYATVLKRGGVSTGKISEALGHRAEKITQTYLKSFSNEEIDSTDEVLLCP
jgi:integrase